MALRLIGMAIQKQAPKISQMGSVASIHTLEKIGSREVVGNGWNSQASYQDRVDYPMPAIRFREDTPEICALREKEKCDWKKLSMEEKKALYRASFCQTFAEMKAGTGEWKKHLGIAFIFVSFGIWASLLMNIFGMSFTIYFFFLIITNAYTFYSLCCRCRSFHSNILVWKK